MPVKLDSKLPPASAEARIEIIPLIDIMFFLLAAFMLVSLSLVNLKSVKVSLPTATLATPETRQGLVTLAVDKAGLVYFERTPVGEQELAGLLAACQKTNAGLRVLIRGDQEARHGAILRVLDQVRSAGIDKVAFEIRPAVAPHRP